MTSEVQVTANRQRGSGSAEWSAQPSRRGSGCGPAGSRRVRSCRWVAAARAGAARGCVADRVALGLGVVVVVGGGVVVVVVGGGGVGRRGGRRGWVVVVVVTDDWAGGRRHRRAGDGRRRRRRRADRVVQPVEQGCCCWTAGALPSSLDTEGSAFCAWSRALRASPKWPCCSAALAWFSPSRTDAAASTELGVVGVEDLGQAPQGVAGLCVAGGQADAGEHDRPGRRRLRRAAPGNAACVCSTRLPHGDRRPWPSRCPRVRRAVRRPRPGARRAVARSARRPGRRRAPSCRTRPARSAGRRPPAARKGQRDLRVAVGRQHTGESGMIAVPGTAIGLIAAAPAHWLEHAVVSSPGSSCVPVDGTSGSSEVLLRPLHSSRQPRVLAGLPLQTTSSAASVFRSVPRRGAGRRAPRPASSRPRPRSPPPTARPPHAAPGSPAAWPAEPATAATIRRTAHCIARCSGPAPPSVRSAPGLSPPARPGCAPPPGGHRPPCVPRSRTRRRGTVGPGRGSQAAPSAPRDTPPAPRRPPRRTTAPACPTRARQYRTTNGRIQRQQALHRRRSPPTAAPTAAPSPSPTLVIAGNSPGVTLGAVPIRRIERDSASPIAVLTTVQVRRRPLDARRPVRDRRRDLGTNADPGHGSRSTNTGPVVAQPGRMHTECAGTPVRLRAHPTWPDPG